MARQPSKIQKETVERVMHAFKHGALESHDGQTVKNPKQAIAIALNESGSSKFNSDAENRRNLARSKRRKRAAAMAETAGAAKSKTRRTSSAGLPGAARSAADRSKADLYAEARRRGIAGRSRMSKDALAHALD